MPMLLLSRYKVLRERDLRGLMLGILGLEKTCIYTIQMARRGPGKGFDISWVLHSLLSIAFTSDAGFSS